jgi:hypothetical protein
MTEDNPSAGRFADSSITRRDFGRLAAAAGATLALPGNATADVSSDAFTAEYQYVLNHTPEDHAVPTLVRFSDASGPSTMEAAVDTEVITTTEPEPAAYGQLTAPQASTVADLPSASEFQFAPGSNPFWRIGYYPFGVFPEPRRSVDYIGFEQLKDGLAELEERYPDRVRRKNVGYSPGHSNNATDRPDPKGMWIAEVTNFDSTTKFEDKEKVFFSCSLHGPERAGAETGARVVENVARHSEPDIEGNNEKINRYLDDVVVIVGFVNPDGWVARNPQYDSAWQFDFGDIPAAPLYERGNAEVYDSNRQYPSVGYIIPPPGHFPAEPKGADHVKDSDGIDADAPDYVFEKVPDAATMIEHFRGYENLNYGADLHGGPIFNEFVLGLISQDQFDTRDLHELYEMCLNIDETLEAALDKWVTAGNIKKAVLGDYKTGLLFGVLPEQAFDYSTIYDTIDYTVSGAFLDWMAHPEELGGLGMTTLDFEMSFSWAVNGQYYNPELVEMEVTGYRTAMRTITAFAYRNSDTPNSEDEFEAYTETGGESVAYVTTGEVGDPDEDLLCRDDSQLQYGQPAVADTKTYNGVIGPGTFAGPTTTEHTFDTANVPDVAEEVRASLSWQPGAQDLEFILKDPDGLTVASARSPSNPERVDAVLRKEGTYTFVVETWANGVASYDIEAEFLAPPSAVEESNQEAGSTETDGDLLPISVGAESVAVETVDVSGEDLHSMGVHVHAHQAFFDVKLVSPSGDTVHSFEAVTDERAGGKCCGLPEWQVAEPETGTWTVRLRNRAKEAERGEIQFWTLSSSLPNPDPKDAVGYEQREYNVSPFRFFEDYDASAPAGEVSAETIQDVAAGGLFDADGNRKYDHVVVIHDFTADGYVAELDRFVDAGGNLVLTDTGSYLLRRLDNTLVDGSAFGERTDIQRRQYEVGRYMDKNLDHPLLTDVRPIQNQLWKVAPLGYSVSGEAPMYLLDTESFESGARGVPSVAGYTDGLVATGSITESADSGRGIHVISSLLPPASQRNIHPFGLLDYTVSFLGYLVLTSALGFQQVRETASTTRRYGRGDEWQVEEPSVPEFSVSGSRADDGSAFTAGQTNHVRVTIEEADFPDEVDREATVKITDESPWKVHVGRLDAKDQEGDTVVLEDATVGEVEEGLTREYFAEAPETTGSYEFGEARVVLGEHPDVDNTEDAFGGTDTNYVVGADQNDPAGSTTDSATGSTSDGEGLTGSSTDAVEDSTSL